MLFSKDDCGTLGKTVSDLIAIQSLSGDEAPLADYIAAFLKKAGLPAERDDQDNVVAIVEPQQAGEARQNTLHLSGHMDTVVPVEGWTADPYKPLETGSGEDRRIVGLGASDMKSGLAVMLHLMKHLARHRPQRLRVVASFTVCEEASGKGKRNGVNRVVQKYPGRWAITTEASCDASCPSIELGCQGHAGAKVALRGRASHSANPERGLNAIHAAAKICTRVAELHRSFKELPILGQVRARAAASVTLIKGGAASNIIPDRCDLTISRRLAPGEDIAKVQLELAELTRDLDGVESEWNVRADAPACVVDLKGPLLKCASEASQELFGQARYSWNRARTDMVLFKQAGMDVLDIGPGFAGQPHVAGEFVRVIDLPRAANLIAETMQRLERWLKES